MRALNLVLLLLVLGAASASADTAKVTYVTSRTFYVDAGERSGLVADMTLDVLRADEVIGQGRVVEVSTTRAVCEWLDGGGPAQVGDTVRFTPVATAAPAAAGSGRSRDGFAGMHGRIGLQTLHLRDKSGYGSDFDQPALTLRLRGDEVAGTPLSVEADVRGRMLYRDGERASRSRIYRLNVSSTFGDGYGWTAGRQYAPSLSVIHLFDGVRVEVDRGQWSAGVLGGTQPEPKYYGWSSNVVEGGAWFTWRQERSRQRWEATVATVAAYENGNVDREFAWLQGRWATGPWSLRMDQVLDLNRSWKQDAGEPLISSTSTYIAARWQRSHLLGIDAGLDTRRQVRFYRDRETPETDFDDNYRQGYWLGLRSRPLRWLDLGLSGRTRLRKDAERADSGTLTVGVANRDWTTVRLDSRSTVYRDELVTGWLQSVRLSAPLHPRLTAGVFGGARGESGRSNDLMDSTDPWYGFDLDLILPHDVWCSLSFESTTSGEEAYDQVWLGTGVRF